MRSFLQMLAVSAAVLAVGSVAQPSKDRVPVLPGWSAPLPSAIYSGYVEAEPGQYIHYVLVEATEGTPASLPLTLWSNGGPGATSLIGWLTELGTFMLDDRSMATNASAPTLFRNPYAWSQLSNMLYFEHPAGVGFSWCGSQAACNANDTSAGQTLAAALSSFMDLFPEYNGRDFFITGESYAGVYIPEAVLALEARADSRIALKGFAIGDGCVGLVGACGKGAEEVAFEFFSGVNFISQDLTAAIEANCQWAEKPLSAECEALLQDFETQVGNPFIYYVYSSCPNDDQYSSSLAKTATGKLFSEQFVTDAEDPTLRMHKTLARRVAGQPKEDGVFSPLAGFPRTAEDRKALQALRHRMQRDPKLVELHNSAIARQNVTNGTVDVPITFYCGTERAMEAWLDETAVQVALHVNASSQPYFFNYTRTEKDLRPYYTNHFISRYRVLQYSGQADACVPLPDTQQWIRELGLPLLRSWAPWKAPVDSVFGTKDVLAGYTTVWGNSSANITYYTINDAGHMVPQYRSPMAFEMFRRFLSNEL